MRSGGGWSTILYSLRKARESGGLLRFYRRMRLRNACKTCAVGMGGQRGGMRNEVSDHLEVCKKSFQAQAADMMAPIGEDFFQSHTHEALLRWTPKQLEDAGRIGFPLLIEEGQSHWRRISWRQALDLAHTALRRATPQQTVFYASGRSCNEAAFLLQCFARVYGTNNVTNCSYYCHQASGVGLGLAIGSGTSTIEAADLEHADFAMVVGANPASNHPRLIKPLVDIRKRGGKVIIVNPLREAGLERFRIPSRIGSLLLGSRVSDVYVQPHIGADIAFLKGVAKTVLELGAVDEPFLQQSVTGWQELRDDLQAAAWSDLVTVSGVPREQMQEVGRLYAAADNAIFLWAMGVTQHAHGVENILAIANLAMLRGMLGRPHAGLLPIRGHSNVQGVGSVGVVPALKEAFQRRLEAAYNIRVPEKPGWDTFESIQAMGQGRVEVALLLGGNLYGASPDPQWTASCMQQVGTSISISTKLNPGHFHGRGKTALILPARTRDEEAQSTTQESMFNYIRLSDGGAPPASPEMRSEVEIIASLAAGVLPPEPIDWQRWKDHRQLRREIAAVVPGYEAMGDIDASKHEFTVSGRVRHTPKFGTADGKARMHVTPIPDLRLDEGEMRLMTLRSEGQFNTVVYEEDDVYRGVQGRDVVMMHPDDVQRLHLQTGDRVQVVSEAGTYGPVRVVCVDIRPGNLAAYCPEANVLVPRAVDPRSRTPVFKNVAVRVVPLEASAAMPDASVSTAGRS
jgi:molybdopterin-dependent oxidoreductase alpha subunit